MADVQPENGYTKIANQIAEALAKTKLSNYESRCLWVLWRQTYGYGKKADWIALSQFVSKTGIQKAHVCRSLSTLLRRNIITKKHEGGAYLGTGGGAYLGTTFNGNDMKLRSYGFQKDFDRWLSPLPKEAPPLKGSAYLGNKVVPKEAPTKESLTKERIHTTSGFSDETQKTPPKTKKETFLLFWSAYPRKVGKTAALRAWVKVKELPPIDHVLSQLEKQKKSEQWIKEKGKYIPHPTRWINEGRWDDELPERYMTPQQRENEAFNERAKKLFADKERRERERKDRERLGKLPGGSGVVLPGPGEGGTGEPGRQPAD